MTTRLEVLDSAVKIGLGALISGVATFLVTRNNQQHEFKKQSREDRKVLLREVSLVLEEGTSNLNRCIHDFGKEGSTKDLGQMLEALNAINKAQALSCLFGSNLLFKAISDYSDSVENLYEYLYFEQSEYDDKKANDFVQEMNSQWETINPLLMKSYQDIWKDA